jgi:hypothetical protein
MPSSRRRPEPDNKKMSWTARRSCQLIEADTDEAAIVRWVDKTKRAGR